MIDFLEAEDCKRIKKDLEEVTNLLNALFKITFPNKDQVDFVMSMIPKKDDIFPDNKKIYTLMFAGALYIENMYAACE